MTMTSLDGRVRLAEAGAGALGPPHDEFLGLPFCLLSQRQVAWLVIEQCGAPYRYVVTPNAFHVVAAHEHPDRLLPVYRSAWLSLCDSRIVSGLAAIAGRSLPLVTGSDVVATLLGELNDRPAIDGRRRLLVVGPGAAAELALRARYRHLNVEVLPVPHGLGQSADLRLGVARACVERPWDILLLCVGCPAQELIARLIAQLGRRSGVALCVGAAIDFLTGRQRRAPLWLQRLSLEWAFRLALEPRRLWRRYLLKSPKILRIFLATRPARRR
jgi:N-acetylglucosaminyldiphosphoundecaprenol N-acetyl-beta-D-mannosaminyltransferase